MMVSVFSIINGYCYSLNLGHIFQKLHCFHFSILIFYTTQMHSIIIYILINVAKGLVLGYQRCSRIYIPLSFLLFMKNYTGKEEYIVGMV